MYEGTIINNNSAGTCAATCSGNNATCKVSLGNGRNQCGETETLSIIHEFQKLYVDKLTKIDADGNLQAKINLQQDWIRDLTEQNTMLVQAVEELEQEAIERVTMLEERLKQTAMLDSCSKVEEEVLGKCGKNFSDVQDKSNIIQKLQSEEIKLKKKLKENEEKYEELQRSAMDMREALTAEVADKHDCILAQKREIQLLEEQCRQADKQTHFKDDIIKELRKEIKQQKCQMSCSDEVNKLRDELNCMRRKYEALVKESDCQCKKIRNLENDLKIKNSKAKNQNLIDKRIATECDCNKGSKDLNCTCYEFNGEHSTDRLKRELEESNCRIKQLEEALQSVNSNNQLIKNKDEVIRLQNDTLNISEIELQALRQKVCEVEREKLKHSKEYEKLVNMCNEQQDSIKNMEAALQEAHCRAENLQDAVDLYLNSVKILEESKQRSETEINQQRITINNLQQVLVTTKNQLDELQNKTSADFQKQFNAINILYANLLDGEEKTLNYQREAVYVFKSCEKLRNVHLDLQVAYRNLEKDMCIADERIIKYIQEIQKESCSAQKLKKQNDYYVRLIGYMQPEMNALKVQLTQLQETLEIASTSFEQEKTNLRETVNALRKRIDCQCQQINALKCKLHSQIKLNEVHVTTIEDLKQKIGVKAIAMNRYIQALDEVKTQLKSSTCENRRLKSLLDDFRNTIAEYEEMQKSQEEKTVYCQKQIECFCKNINILKDQTQNLQHQLQCKCDEVMRLKKLCKAHENSINVAKDGCKESKDHYENQLGNLKTMINDLNDNLKQSEENFFRLHKEYEICQNKLLDSVQRERNQQEDFMRQEEHDLMRKIQNSTESYESILSKLEKENVRLKEIMDQKDAEIKILKLNQKNNSQESCNCNKDELCEIAMERDKLVMENEKLKDYVDNFCITIDTLKIQNNQLSEDLRQNREEIETLRNSKNHSDKKLSELQHQLSCIQTMCTNLQNQLKSKSDTIVNLEAELQDLRLARDEVCSESKTVVINVRSWIQEQKNINNNLSDSIRRKNIEIEKLSAQKENLVSIIYDLKRRLSQLRNLRSSRKNLKQKRIRFDSTGSRTSIRSDSLDGTFSPCTSLMSSSTSINSDQSTRCPHVRCHGGRDYLSADETTHDRIPTVWIRKVHSLTADIQKNNRYWKSKLNEAEYMVSKDE